MKLLRRYMAWMDEEPYLWFASAFGMFLAVMIFIFAVVIPATVGYAPTEHERIQELERQVTELQEERR